MIIDLVNEIKAQREAAADNQEKQSSHVSASSSW